MKKVFTMRAASIGDALMGKYLLENVHSVYPDAKCYLLVSQREKMIKDLLSAYTWIEVLHVNRKKPVSLFKTILKLWGCNFTVTQYSHTAFSMPSKLFARLVTSHGCLVGFEDKSKWNKLIYSHLLPKKFNEVTKLLEQKALLSMGIKPTIEELTLKYKEDTTAFDKINKSAGYILLHLFSGSIGRGLSDENRARVVKAVVKGAGNIPVFLTGTSAQRDDAKKATCGTSAEVIAGDTSIKSLVTLIDKSIVVVSLDTGVGHIAAHLKKPSIILSSFQTQGWWNKPQYGSHVTVLSAEKGRDEAPDCRIAMPESLNNISSELIISKVQQAIKE